jgi:hypothetical protein
MKTILMLFILSVLQISLIAQGEIAKEKNNHKFISADSLATAFLAANRDFDAEEFQRFYYTKITNIDAYMNRLKRREFGKGKFKDQTLLKSSLITWDKGKVYQFEYRIAYENCNIKVRLKMIDTAENGFKIFDYHSQKENNNSTDPVKCVYCSSMNRAGSYKCSSCGAPLK